MKRFLSVFLLFFVINCGGPPPPVPPPTDTDKCVAAGNNLEKLQCKDSKGDPLWVNKSGEPFSKTCQIIQEEGRVSIDPTCIATAKTCQEADSCPVN